MTSDYPSNVVPYNLVRYNTPDSPTGDIVIVAYKMPSNMRPLFTGAVSTLIEVNNWNKYGTLTAQDTVDVFNNEVIEVDVCELLLQCLQNDDNFRELVQQIINQYADSDVFKSKVINNTIITESADSNGCTSDARFGRAVAFVEYLDQNMLDFYQQIDAASNALLRLDELVSAIPIVETLPIDEIIGAIADTGELWRDSYEASITNALKEKVACEIFCAFDDCDISLSQVLDLFLQRYIDLDSALDVLTIFSVILRISSTVGRAGGLAYIGDDFVYISWILQLFALTTFDGFLGLSLQDYAQATSGGVPSGDWATDCNSCEPEPAGVVRFDGASSDLPYQLLRDRFDNGLTFITGGGVNGTNCAAQSNGYGCNQSGAANFAIDFEFDMRVDVSGIAQISEFDLQFKPNCNTSNVDIAFIKVQITDNAGSVLYTDTRNLNNSVAPAGVFSIQRWQPSNPIAGGAWLRIIAEHNEPGINFRSGQTYRIDDIRVFS